MHRSRSFLLIFLLYTGMKLKSNAIVWKICFLHVDLVSVEVELSDFQHTKIWFLYQGIEVQGQLTAMEEKTKY